MSQPLPLPTPLPSERFLTMQEYFALEEASPVRHEYLDGLIYAMSGVTLRHSQIVMNIGARLWAARRGGPCRVHQGEVMVRVGRVIYYPDVMVACAPRRGAERVEDAPCLLVEVLSPSTESTDRREKLLAYRRIRTLRTYLIVDQERRLVDRYWRADDGKWRRETLVNEGAIALPCPELTLTLDEIYEGVELPPLERVLRVRERAAAYG